MYSADTPLLKETTSALKNIYGERLAKIILYGSYARGEQTPESDIDLLVVLKDSDLSIGKEIRAIVESIYDIGIHFNISISVHPITKERFETGRTFFLDRVRKEGKEL